MDVLRKIARSLGKMNEWGTSKASDRTRVIEMLAHAASTPLTQTPPKQSRPHSVVPIPGVDDLSDHELERLNQILPWASFVIDSRGRRFGAAYSATKRNVPQDMPDLRIVDLDRRMDLSNLTVLEIGCFEGIHTAALAMRAKRVIACDSRIENVVKTIVRCALYGAAADIFRWDVEEDPPPSISLSCDVLHHVGVLYHLTDPVGHLSGLLPHVRKGLMLDTQIAQGGTASHEYISNGRTYRYKHYREGGRNAPFAGMLDHAKWLYKEDILAVLHDAGFNSIDVASLKMERNGPRLLVYAQRCPNCPGFGGEATST